MPDTHSFEPDRAVPQLREDGATATEYAIIITLIAGVILTVIFVIGGQMSGFFQAAAEVF